MRTWIPHHLRRQASVDYPRYPPQPSVQESSQQSSFQHILQPSDYESDNPAYLSDLPPPPQPTTRTNDELNLAALRRHNPEISSILSIAPYAVIYTFSPHPEPAWIKSGTEGSLFICQLVPGSQLGDDRYIAVVLNRRGLDNFQAELREGEVGGVEITDEYVIVSFREHEEQRIYGIWIFSDGPGSSTERIRTLTAELMKQCAVQAGLSLQAAEAAAAEAATTTRNGDSRTAYSSFDDGGFDAPIDRQMSLQEMFGRQRAEDASWSVRVHSPQERDPWQSGTLGQHAQLQSPTLPMPQQQDVLEELFRKAGIEYRH